MRTIPKFSNDFLPLGMRRSKQAFARGLRRKLTSAEWLLWNELRHDAFGFRWRTQRLVLGWVVDFWCSRHNLAVEIDGGYHASQEQSARDVARDQAMRRRGVTVLRFTNAEVETNLPAVLAEIGRHCNDKTEE